MQTSSQLQNNAPLPYINKLNIYQQAHNRFATQVEPNYNKAILPIIGGVATGAGLGHIIGKLLKLKPFTGLATGTLAGLIGGAELGYYRAHDISELLKNEGISSKGLNVYISDEARRKYSNG